MRILIFALAFGTFAAAQPATPPAKTVLAIGAHAGDMDLTAGATLLHQKKAGARIVFLHMTLGEGGNPALPPEKYAEQKRAEAEIFANALGAEVRFAPYHDGQIPDNDETRRWIADAIRDIQPSTVITHWSNSIHKDHALTNRLVNDAILMASLPDIKTSHPAWRGIRSVLFAENWEDPDGFHPYLYVDVSDAFEEWRTAVRKYEFVRGGVSAFRYFDYYDALLRLRGAEARKAAAQAFDIESMGKRKILDKLP